MKANPETPRELFDGKVHFEIPPFQRPYVWNEEDQWQPLWDDLTRLMEAMADANGAVGEPGAPAGHFLGALVLKYRPPGNFTDPVRASVIDGQQRITTLQVLLDAAQLVVSDLGHAEDAEALQELVWNGAERFKGTPWRFKLWPSRVDRAAFEAAMDDAHEASGAEADSRIVLAHCFFEATVREWATSAGSDQVEARLHLLSSALQGGLQVVAITLDENDDSQVIFETLNDRGTPLLAADLIKNYVFQRCEDIGADVDVWAEKYWGEFDEDWWRELVSQGRLYRSRIDLFLQYWLTMRLRSEIPADAVFARFRAWADEQLAVPGDAETLLTELVADAGCFAGFADLDHDTAAGSFYRRVVETLELGAFIPLLLWMQSETNDVPAGEVAVALSAVESWAVRRTLLRRTMKDVNKLVVSLLQVLGESDREAVGSTVERFLSSQTADARQWPTDDELIQHLPSIPLWGNIRQPRIRLVLEAVETSLRTPHSEPLSLPAGLEVEHIMPRGWTSNWDDGVSADPQAAAARNRRIHTIGNLTLTTGRLNKTLSNRLWLDQPPKSPDAPPVAGKRTILSKYSLLIINKRIVDEHVTAWTDADIEARGATLSEAVTGIWPGPSTESD